jgi:hypothetical protein
LEDIIKLDNREIGQGFRDWIDLAQYQDIRQALLNVFESALGPLNVGNFLNNGGTVFIIYL